MAIVFELWAECPDEASRTALAEHFAGATVTLLTGCTLTWYAELVGPPHYPLAVRVGAEGLSRTGVSTIVDALETTEAGLHLYHRLKDGPPFRFARVGWDPECVPMAELTEYVAPFGNGEVTLQVECAFDDDLYRQLGAPALCYPFRPGYRWTRYRGEQYQPLYRPDQPDLNGVCKRLFPEYFGG